MWRTVSLLSTNACVYPLLLKGRVYKNIIVCIINIADSRGVILLFNTLILFMTLQMQRHRHTYMRDVKDGDFLDKITNC